MKTTSPNQHLVELLKLALVGLKYGADLAFRVETTDSCHRDATIAGPKIEGIENEIKRSLASLTSES